MNYHRNKIKKTLFKLALTYSFLLTFDFVAMNIHSATAYYNQHITKSLFQLATIGGW